MKMQVYLSPKRSPGGASVAQRLVLEEELLVVVRQPVLGGGRKHDPHSMGLPYMPIRPGVVERGSM